MRYRKIRCPEPSDSLYQLTNRLTGERYESMDVAKLLREIAKGIGEGKEFWMIGKIS